MRRAYLIYNPGAGRYPSWLFTERAAELLRSLGWEIRLEQTRDGAHIGQLASQAVQEEMDAFLVVGGDGSLNQALDSLIDTQTALGVLPAGTANVWAQELGLPYLTWTRWMALEESARLLDGAQVRSVDVGVCNDRPFLLWAGVGLDAFVVHHIEPRSRLEKYFSVVQYAASTVLNASLWRGMNLRVESDGKSLSGHFLLAVLSNVHLYAGGYAELNPNARLDDGLLDLWLFKGENLGDTVQLAWDLFSGKHLQSGQVERLPFRMVRLESDSPMYVQVDGEPFDTKDGVTINVRPRALRVLVPANTPHSLFSQALPDKLNPSSP